MDFLQICWILCLLFNLLAWSTVYAESANPCPKVTLPNGSTQVRGEGRIITFQCRRNFELIGFKFAVCTTSGQWSKQIPTCVGTKCQKPAIPPNVITEQLHKGGVLRFTCVIGLTRSGPESISCGGEKWSNEPPKCIEAVTMTCDFEKDDLCGWSQDITDDFDWTWHKGETPTANTGPRFDHTTNSSEGHYLFIESSAPQEPGQKARIISPAYLPDKVKNMCMEFFYHMFGPDGAEEVGDLDVYTKPQSMDSTMLTAVRRIFHRGGNQGDQWIRADIPIPQLTEPFNFVIQATRLKSWTGDISIDDFRLHSCDTQTTNTPSNTAGNDDSKGVTNNPSPDLTAPKQTTRRPTTTKRKRKTRRPNAQLRSTTALPTLKTSTIKTVKITTTKSKIEPTARKTTKTDVSTVSFSVSSIYSADSQVYTQSNSLSQNDIKSNSPSSTPTFITTDINDNIVDNDYGDNSVNNTSNNGLNNNDDVDSDNGNSVIPSSDDKDYDSNIPDPSPGRNRSSGKNDSQAPFIDYDYNSKIDQNGDSFPSGDEDDEVLDGTFADTGAVKNTATPPGRIEFLPLIIGIVASVVVGVTVVAVLAWIWVRSQRQKEEKDDEDQMNIITEYVETNLSV